MSRFVLASALGGMMCVTVQGQVIEWAAGVDGPWGNASFWDPMNVPNVAGETAVIGVGGMYVVTMTGADSPTLDALDLSNSEAQLNMMSGSTLTLLSAFVNNGLIVVNNNQNNGDTTIDVTASMVLEGAGEIRLNRFDDAARLMTTGDGVSLEIGAMQTVSGSGAIEGSILNRGLVVGSSSNFPLRIRSGELLNEGILQSSSNGTLSIEQSITQGDGGVVRADGGLVRFPLGTTTTVTGGAFETVSESVIEKGSSGTLTLDGVTNLGNLNIVSGGFVSVVGDLHNDGVIRVNSNEAGSDSALDFTASGTISGGGTIVLTRPGNDSRLRTIGDDVVVTIAEGVVAGWGAIEGDFINEGLIVADREGLPLEIRFGSMVNRDSLTASLDGILDIEQEIVQEGNGWIGAVGGTVRFPTGTNASIVGGLLKATNGGVVEKSPSGALTLSDVTLDADLMILAGGVVKIDEGGLVNDGLLLVNSNNAGSDSIVEATVTTMISGEGEIRLNRAGNDARLRSILGGTLTVGADQTITGSGSIDGDVTIQGVHSPGDDSDATAATAANSGLLTFDGSSSLLLDLDGPLAFDAIGGTSNIVAGGSLEVSLVDGYEPAFGDSYILLDGPAVTGTFDSVSLPPLAGNLEWVLKYNPGDVTLFITCPGDCNEDGVRNILDFVCFQGLFTAGDPAADCDGNGSLNILDFVCFQQAFQAACK